MSDAVAIRPAREADLEALAALEEESFSGPWSAAMLAEELRRELAWVEVAEVNGQIVGYSCVWRVVDTCHLLRVATAPGLRRRGVGRALLLRLEARARAAGLREVELEVASRNAPAIALYRALGYVEVGRRRAYYRDPIDDALLMSRVIEA